MLPVYLWRPNGRYAMTSTSPLMQIQPFIQDYVLAVSSILDAAVTVVDNDLIRIGGTANYSGQIGEKINHTAFFRDVLESGRPDFIRDVRKEKRCSDCPGQGSCEELADMAYPIFLGKQVVGVIGVIAFKEAERQRFLRDQAKIMEFLKYMCMLIESRLLTDQRTQELERQMGEVISKEKKEFAKTPFIGRNKVVRDILALVEKVSSSDSTILLCGESGTGKEVMARYIHNISPRGTRLMTSVNCGAIPDTLVESELFGYEDGAFTGARRGGQIGKFELASGSTLFLDEIGEMPLHVQPKLLRVLQDRTVQRLGGKNPRTANVRIICATNRDLKQQVAEGSFRNDLYYRLNVIPITLPPLRERREDIPLFISHFLTRYNQMFRKNILGFDDAAMNAFLSYDWPGNVRELRNMVEYLVNIVEGEYIRALDLPEHFLVRAHKQPAGRSLKNMMEEHEKLILEQLLHDAETTAAKKKLAQSLGISNATLYRKLAGYGLL